MTALPALVFASDCSELHGFEYAYKAIGLKNKVCNLGLEQHGEYVGLVYSGRYPSKKKIKALLEDFGVKFID